MNVAMNLINIKERQSSLWAYTKLSTRPEATEVKVPKGKRENMYVDLAVSQSSHERLFYRGFLGISPWLQQYSSCKFGVLLSKNKHHTVTALRAGALSDTKSENSISHAKAAIRSANNLKSACGFHFNLFPNSIGWSANWWKWYLQFSLAYSALVYYTARIHIEKRMLTFQPFIITNGIDDHFWCIHTSNITRSPVHAAAIKTAQTQ